MTILLGSVPACRSERVADYVHSGQAAPAEAQEGQGVHVHVEQMAKVARHLMGEMTSFLVFIPCPAISDPFVGGPGIVFCLRSDSATIRFKYPPAGHSHISSP